jgi:cell division protein ZapA
MSRRTVDLRIAGQSYRVVSSAPEADLKRFAAVISDKLAEVTPRGRAVQPQAMLLAAMALAHEVEAERDQRAALERRTRDLLRRAMVRIDAALEPLEEPDAAEGE